MLRGTTEVHRFVKDAAVGEAAFAADAGGDRNEGAEDAGYLMAYIADPERGGSDLVVLSAQDFTGPPVARVHLPVRVPLGFPRKLDPGRLKAAHAPRSMGRARRSCQWRFSPATPGSPRLRVRGGAAADGGMGLRRWNPQRSGR